MTPGNPVADLLVRLLSGEAQAAPIPSAGGARPALPVGSLPAARFPQTMQPPPMRPDASLPGGSFAPNAAPAPAPVAEPAVPQGQNPLMALLGGGGSGGDFRSMLRAFGAGAAQGSGGRGDPFEAFGRGFGGAAQHYTVQEELDARAASDAEKLAYDRSRDATSDQRDADKDARDAAKDERDFELRMIAEERQGKTADLANQKTAMEIRREARMNGITTAQQLEVERISQAAAENIYDPEQRAAIVDKTRREVLDRIGAGQGSGLSGSSSGLSAPSIGAVEDGYRFKGGDASDPNNWTPLG